jgi:hypothetical protein
MRQPRRAIFVACFPRFQSIACVRAHVCVRFHAASDVTHVQLIYDLKGTSRLVQKLIPKALHGAGKHDVNISSLKFSNQYPGELLVNYVHDEVYLLDTVGATPTHGLQTREPFHVDESWRVFVGKPSPLCRVDTSVCF